MGVTLDKFMMVKNGGRQGSGWFRPMTLAEVHALTYRQEVWLVSVKASEGVVRTRVDSKVKRWKRDVDRFEVTLKYGLYQSCRFSNRDLPRFLVEVPGDE